MPVLMPEGDDDVDNASSDEREQGPSWARDNWPLVELDEVNAGLDPTLSALERSPPRRKAAAAAPAQSDAEIERAANDCDLRDDADPHLSGARPSRRRSRSARPRPSARCRPISRPNITASPATALDRPVFLGGALGLEQATRPRARRDPAPQLLRQCRPRIYAHQRPRGAPLPAGADGGPRGRDPLHPRGQADRS